MGADLIDYRLDIYAPAARDVDPDTLLDVVYFEAPTGLDAITTVLGTAAQLLADHDGPGDRYGEIYERVGAGAAGAFYDLVELPDSGAR